MNARLAANGGEDGFEDLAVRVLQWVLAAGMSGAMSPDQLNQQVVSADFLNQALKYFSNPDQPLPIPADQVEAFLARQATICFAATAAANAHGVFFPAPPGVRLNVPSYAGAPGYDYAFGQYNSSQTDYICCCCASISSNCRYKWRAAAARRRPVPSGCSPAPAPPSPATSSATTSACWRARPCRRCAMAWATSSW
ncbi:hypothetical protein JOS77_23020 [Chromobacterium haemolyticum]|nr:hypothetical protein JOS77_23020 [Chromobacterium haemolyticum]